MKLSESWKAFERQVASVLDGHRILQKGLDVTDVISGDGRIAAECKYRGKLPQWIRDGLGSAMSHKDAELHVLCLKERRQKGFYVLISSEEFEKFLWGSRT